MPKRKPVKYRIRMVMRKWYIRLYTPDGTETGHYGPYNTMEEAEQFASTLHKIEDWDKMNEV